MNTSTTAHFMLNITRKPPTEAGALVFLFEGNIDAQAAESLRELYAIPPRSAACLDFSRVQRVNSMGLALLLKLFEHWEAQSVDIKVAHANRMASMLFKMTKLDHYLVAAPASPAKHKPEAGEARAPARPQPLQQPEPAPPTKPPVGAAHREARPVGPGHAPPPPVGKLNFLANMQSSRQLNGWYFFNTYLQRRLGREIHLDLVHAAWDNELRPSSTHLVFAHPFQSTRLLLEHGFHLVARPAEMADEATLLVRADDPREMADFAGGTVTADTAESFAYLLGRFMLDEGGLPSESLRYAFAGHEIKAVRSLLGGQADILFLPSESYENLSALAKKQMRVLDKSDSGLAFHSFCLAPACLGLLDELRSTLLEMAVDGKGRQVLDDLGLTDWEEPAQEEINMLAMLYTRYGVRK